MRPAMLRLLAIAFPALVLAAVWALLRPGRVPRRLAHVPLPSRLEPAASPLSLRLAAQGTYFVLSVALTALLGVAQHALLVTAGEAPGGAWSHRLSDEWPIALLVALFVAIVAAYPLTVGLLHARLGDRLAPLLDEPGPGRFASTLRRQIIVAPRLAVAVGVVAVIFLAATFENALVVRDGNFRFRPLFGSPTTRRIEEVTCLRVRTGWGRGRGRRFLELELRDGTVISPGNVVEGRVITPAIAALQAQAPRRLPVRPEGPR